MDNIALRFRSGLVDLIEQKRRRSRATLRILRLKIDQRWPEDEMRDVQVISGRLLKRKGASFLAESAPNQHLAQLSH